MATKRKVAARYTTRACDFCKARHLRCDGLDICFQCKKRNQSCNYTQKNVKRGPKPKKKRLQEEEEEEGGVGGSGFGGLRKEADDLEQTFEGGEDGFGLGLRGVSGASVGANLLPNNNLLEAWKRFHNEELYPPGMVRSVNYPMMVGGLVGTPGGSDRSGGGVGGGTGSMVGGGMEGKDFAFQGPSSSSSSYSRGDLPSSIADPSMDDAMAILTAFAEKVSVYHPNNFTLDHALAYEVWKQLVLNHHYTKLNELVDAFVYTVVFAHGSRVIGNESLCVEFSLKGEELAHALFLSPSSLIPEIYDPFADALVASATLLGVLKLESGDFNGARLCFAQAYNVLNMHVNDVTPSVAHRLYAYLTGMSRSTFDVAHWASNAHALGPETNTAINRVMLALLYCCPGMLRDPKNKPLPLVLHIPPGKQKGDQTIYQKMLRELDETEHSINSNNSNNSIWEEEKVDHLMSYRIVIDGCRAMVFAQCGFADQAAICAEKCIRDSKSLQARVSYWALPVTLAYSLQVIKTLNLALFNEGLPVLSLYSQYPIVQTLLHILSSKSLPLDLPPALDVPPPAPMVGLNMEGLGGAMGGAMDAAMGGMDLSIFMNPLGMGLGVPAIGMGMGGLGSIGPLGLGLGGMGGVGVMMGGGGGMGSAIGLPTMMGGGGGHLEGSNCVPPSVAHSTTPLPVSLPILVAPPVALGSNHEPPLPLVHEKRVVGGVPIIPLIKSPDHPESVLSNAQQQPISSTPPPSSLPAALTTTTSTTTSSTPPPPHTDLSLSTAPIIGFQTMGQRNGMYDNPANSGNEETGYF